MKTKEKRENIFLLSIEDILRKIVIKQDKFRFQFGKTKYKEIMLKNNKCLNIRI
jgi:hypothetical protein